MVLAVMGLAAVGCGGDDTDAPAEPEAIQVTIETADYTEVKGDLATVTGTVDPPDATVEVAGVTADVSDGKWTARVRLEEVGDNSIEATATYEELTPAEATTVLVRKPTKAELAAVRREKAKARARAAKRRQAAAARRARAREKAAARRAAQEGAQGWTMPDLTGQDLQSAQDAIQSLTNGEIFFTYSHDASGQGRAALLDRGWQVCTQDPAPGSTITADSNIDFGVVRVSEQCP